LRVKKAERVMVIKSYRQKMLAVLMLLGAALFFPLPAISQEIVASQENDINQGRAVIKSDIDPNNYRYFTLSNQLKVILISNSTLKKGAVALNLSVGSAQDPENKAGLAHLLAKNLLVATKKYPEPYAYADFIKHYNGTQGIDITLENTLHFFQIDKEELFPALERFSQSFIAPLLLTDYLDDEIKALNQEYLSITNNPRQLEFSVLAELLNPQHSTTTMLQTTLSGSVQTRFSQQDLQSFYQHYYSPEKMALAVMGPQSLDELEQRVRMYFSALPTTSSDNNSLTMSSNQAAPLFNENSLPASVQIKSNKKERKLSFWFAIANPNQYANQKPYKYIAELLQHQGKGSLQSLLKRLGWAEKIQAQALLSNNKDALFVVDIDLTAEGATTAAREQIISLFFYMIDKMSASLEEDWRYKEMQTLGDIHFRFQENLPVLTKVKNLARHLHHYEPENLLRGDFYFSNYDSQLIQQALNHLKPEKLLWIFSSPQVNPYRISRYNAVPFNLRLGIPAQYEIKPSVQKILFLAEENPFVPKRLSVKTSSLLDSPNQLSSFVPQLVLENKYINVWFAQNHEFADPRAMANFRLQSPLSITTVENAALSRLFVELLKDDLSEIAYVAYQAGIELDITPIARGFDIRIFGYSSRQGLLINKVIEAIANADFSEERFSVKKKSLMMLWRKQETEMPISLLLHQANRLHAESGWTSQEMLRALEKKSFNDFMLFSDRHLIDARVDALFFGNYYREEALKLAVIVEYGLLKKQTGRLIPAIQLLTMPEFNNKPWLYANTVNSEVVNSNNFNANTANQESAYVGLLIQGASPSLQDSAHMLLLQDFFQSPFFREYTQEKFGSVNLQAIPARLRPTEHTFFIVHSKLVETEQLMSLIDELMQEQYSLLQQQLTTNPQFLINLQQKMIKNLGMPAASLKEQADRYWQSILTKDYSFSYSLQLINAITRITPESLMNYYQAAFLNKNKRVWLTSKPPSNQNDFNVITSIADYRRKVREMSE
jgi:insulysin